MVGGFLPAVIHDIIMENTSRNPSYEVSIAALRTIPHGITKNKAHGAKHLWKR